MLLILCSALSCKVKHDHELDQLNFIKDSLSTQNYMLINSLRSTYHYGFDRINPSARLINEVFDTLSPNQIFSETHTLIFYYSNYACSPCLDRELTLLRSESDSISESKLIIIGAVSSMRSIAAVIRNFNFRCKLYQLDGMTGLIGDQPYMKESMFLLVNQEGRIQTLLVPPKNDDETIMLFFKAVNRHFLK
jgi:hypothetical protein